MDISVFYLGKIDLLLMRRGAMNCSSWWYTRDMGLIIVDKMVRLACTCDVDVDDDDSCELSSFTIEINDRSE